MIYTNSVLKGYNASLGFVFLNLAFLIGTFFIEIPDDKELKIYGVDDIKSLYALQIIVHTLAVALSIMNFAKGYSDKMELVTESFDSVTVILMIVTYMYQW